MNTYQKNGQKGPGSGATANPNFGKETKSTKEKGGVRVNGIQQVIDMLQVADPQFRNSLLKRIAQEDPDLARALRAKLGI